MTSTQTRPGTATGTGGVVTLRRVVQSEWTKLRSLRAPVWLLALTAAGIVVLGTMMAVGTVVAGVNADQSEIDALGGALTGISPVELLVAALGALAVTTEYASGTIRSTLTAVPRRLPVLIGKALVVAGSVFAVALVSVLVAFTAVRGLLGGQGISLPFTAPGVLRALVGAALYLTVIGLLGAGFGWLLRSAVGALAALVGVLYVLPLIGFLLPDGAARVVVPLLPGNAGAAVMQLEPAGMLPPWAGIAVFAGYAVLLLVAAALVLRRRDA
jgi:ABC-type transport system involved in multi-copper enzyme maturation permease subunit